jgi:hypothetical protein
MVCGLDKDHIVLQDPGIGGRRRISRDAFLNVSFDFKNMFPKASEDLIIKRLIIVTPTILSPASFRKLSNCAVTTEGWSRIWNIALVTALSPRRRRST